MERETDSFAGSEIALVRVHRGEGADHLQISGIEVELGNKLRGSRARLAGIIKVAEKALARGFNNRICATDILAMRQSLSDLLTIVKG